MFIDRMSYELTAITGGTVGRELTIKTLTEDPGETSVTRRREPHYHQPHPGHKPWH